MTDRFTTPAIRSFERGLFAAGKESARMLWLPDWHIPQHDRKATDLILNYAKHERKAGRGFDAWGQIGDLMNLHVLSRHNEYDKLTVEGLRLQNDFDIANYELDRLQAEIAGPGVALEGNHDHRLVKYLAAHPELIGTGLTIPEMLKFEERGILWVQNWEKGHVLRIGNATFVHGSIVRKHHAAGMMEKYQTNIFYGHVHDEQKYSVVTAAEDKTRVAHSIGTLQDKNSFWMPYNGNRWQLCFGDFTFFKSGGFSYTIYQIHDYRVAIGGKIFTPKGVI